MKSEKQKDDEKETRFGIRLYLTNQRLILVDAEPDRWPTRPLPRARNNTRALLPPIVLPQSRAGNLRLTGLTQNLCQR
jgi:hypothetical protein